MIVFPSAIFTKDLLLLSRYQTYVVFKLQIQTHKLATNHLTAENLIFTLYLFIMGAIKIIFSILHSVGELVHCAYHCAKWLPVDADIINIINNLMGLLYAYILLILLFKCVMTTKHDLYVVWMFYMSLRLVKNHFRFMELTE